MVPTIPKWKQHIESKMAAMTIQNPNNNHSIQNIIQNLNTFGIQAPVVLKSICQSRLKSEHLLTIQMQNMFGLVKTTVGARIPNAFRFRMVDGLRYSNGVWFSNGP